MEKFIRIAESIADLTVYNAYKIMRIDIQFHVDDNKFHAYVTMGGVNGPDEINIRINPDGSFYEVI